MIYTRQAVNQLRNSDPVQSRSASLMQKQFVYIYISMGASVQSHDWMLMMLIAIADSELCE